LKPVLGDLRRGLNSLNSDTGLLYIYIGYLKYELYFILGLVLIARVGEVSQPPPFTGLSMGKW